MAESFLDQIAAEHSRHLAMAPPDVVSSYDQGLASFRRAAENLGSDLDVTDPLVLRAALFGATLHQVVLIDRGTDNPDSLTTPELIDAIGFSIVVLSQLLTEALVRG